MRIYTGIHGSEKREMQLVSCSVFTAIPYIILPEGDRQEIHRDPEGKMMPAFISRLKTGGFPQALSNDLRKDCQHRKVEIFPSVELRAKKDLPREARAENKKGCFTRHCRDPRLRPFPSSSLLFSQPSPSAHLSWRLQKGSRGLSGIRSQGSGMLRLQPPP